MRGRHRVRVSIQTDRLLSTRHLPTEASFARTPANARAPHASISGWRIALEYPRYQLIAAVSGGPLVAGWNWRVSIMAGRDSRNLRKGDGWGARGCR